MVAVRRAIAEGMSLTDRARVRLFSAWRACHAPPSSAGAPTLMVGFCSQGEARESRLVVLGSARHGLAPAPTHRPPPRPPLPQRPA